MMLMLSRSSFLFVFDDGVFDVFCDVGVVFSAGDASDDVVDDAESFLEYLSDNDDTDSDVCCSDGDLDDGDDSSPGKMKSTFDAASATTLLHFRRLSPSSDVTLDIDDDDWDEARRRARL